MADLPGHAGSASLRWRRGRKLQDNQSLTTELLPGWSLPVAALFK